MKENKMVHGNDAYSLNIFEIFKYKRLAKSGDGEAALLLGRYYEFVHNDFEKSYKWLTLGSENSLECLYEVSILMINSGNPDDVKAGYEGMFEAAAKGNERAVVIWRKRKIKGFCGVAFQTPSLFFTVAST